MSARALRRLLVGVILLAALAIRIGYIDSNPYHAINDAGTYNRMASNIATYGDYHTGSGLKTGAGNTHGPTAYFPPGYPYFLALSDLVTGHEAGGKPAIRSERVEQAIVGTVTVAMVGLVALEAFGGGVALIALLIAAIYPVFIELSGTLVAENLLTMLVLAAIYTALRARRSPRPLAWIAGTGVLTGLATLTHQNAILILLPLGFAAVRAVRAMAPRGPTRGRQAGAVALLVVMTALTILPWTIRNAVELHSFIPVSDETGITLVGTYNPASAAFAPVPYKWRLFSHIPADKYLKKAALPMTEPQLSSLLETKALNYIKANPLSPIEVAFHNTLRMFELEGSYAWHASAYAQGLSVSNAAIGIGGFWTVCVLALAGLFTRAIRQAPRWLWGVPLLLALSVVLINVETPRFREPVDPFLILLASCAVATAGARVRAWVGVRSSSGGAPVRRGRGTPGMAGDRQLV